jgi:hypothetical protein
VVNRKAPGKQPLLNSAQRRELAAVIERGPIPAVDGVVRWRRLDLAGWVYETYGISTSKQTLSRIVRGMGIASCGTATPSCAGPEGSNGF